MFGSKDTPRLVGAKEKREKAQSFNPNYQVKSKKEGKEASPAASLILIWMISTALAFYLSEYVFKTGLGINTGSSFLDSVFFGSGNVTLIGSPDIDKYITIGLRGFLLFLISGFVPFMTYLWKKLIDRGQMNLFLAFWGVTVSLGFIFFMVRDFVWPAIKEILKMIFG